MDANEHTYVLVSHQERYNNIIITGDKDIFTGCLKDSSRTAKHVSGRTCPAMKPGE